MVIRKQQRTKTINVGGKSFNVPVKRTSYSCNNGYGNPNGGNSGQEEGGCLCFILGSVFGPIGILIAAIIAKKSGVIAALWGWIIGWVALFLVWMAFVGAVAAIA